MDISTIIDTIAASVTIAGFALDRLKKNPRYDKLSHPHILKKIS